MIEFRHVSKIYGKVRALDDVTFAVGPGSVTGFLGPNGAGKSTALRVLVGLSRPSSGSATVLGLPYAEMACPGLRAGTLLDAGARHPGRTGREVLTLGAMTLGLPRTRVGEVLDLVGLTERESRRRIGGYSLGMRQRLGIAHALLGDPEVLILDEPANGLDPQGIHWMRLLLRHLADSGCAVLLSSHLLHEVEQVADRIVMIGRGRVLAQGTVEELSRGRGLEQTFLELTAHTDRSPGIGTFPGVDAGRGAA
ncbi:ABC transporter ATP-binding protein [Microbispora rosea]|uniref:ABC transporter ATP-binding protein n=1 Tax=Microbispora rosea TaxID=58117 RepID=UPI0006914B0E|nr:ATP-binding cassette domain-containing protein [Microbispora rosea]